jgi:hypothetical protein
MQKTSGNEFFALTEGKLNLPLGTASALSSVKNADFQKMSIDYGPSLW